MTKAISISKFSELYNSNEHLNILDVREDFEYENPDSGVNYECWECIDGYDDNSDWFCGDILARVSDFYHTLPTADFYAFEHYAAVANQQLASYGLKPSDCVKENPSFIVFLKTW